MILSLRKRVLLIVATINVVIFGFGLMFLARDFSTRRDALLREYSAPLGVTLTSTIDPRGELSVGQILRWPYWDRFEDAMLVHKNLEETRGSIEPRGVFLNLLGRSARAADFDQQGILRAIQTALATRQLVTTHGGVAVPIYAPDGALWGACWFLLAPSAVTSHLVLELLPWFLVSTLLLTLGTFSVLRRFVLDPVRQLADGARRVAGGDLSVRIPEPPREDEIAALIRSFNSMTSKVQGFGRELEQRVEEATEKMRRAEAAAMTQRRLAATGQLAAGIAHEINNPLGGLQNAAEALSRTDLDADKRTRYHGLLVSGLERIRATVGQLLRFTPRHSKAAPYAIVGPAVDAIALVAHRAQAQGVEIRLAALVGGVRVEGEAGRLEVDRLPPLLGDASETGQAVLNLLMNSLDALEGRAPGQGHVDVTLEARPGEVALVVEDNGPGVAPEALPRVADLFYTTKDVGKGTGLGLSIVHAIVTNQGGRVHLASELGRGFRVEIVLPTWKGRTPGEGTR